MKISQKSSTHVMFAVLFLFSFIFLTKTAKTQDTKSDSKSVTKVKIIKEKDGKTTVIDTTFTGYGPKAKEEMKLYIDSLSESLKDVETEMKDMEIAIDLEMDEMEDMDSMLREVEKMIIVDTDGKKGHIRIKSKPGAQGYNYSYTIPDVPDFPMIWDGKTPPCIEIEREFNGSDRMEEHWNHSGSGSINDLLGNIPMERVKSFSIKDKKKGKRIIIDIEDGPVFEPHPRRMIMMGSPSKKHYKFGTDGDVKVIIKEIDESPSERNAIPDEKKEEPGNKNNGNEKI